MVIIPKKIELTSLVDLLTGKVVLKDVDPWHSKIRALSKAISFVENDPLSAPMLLSHTGLQNLTPKRVIGITGLPGSGKSTLTNLLIKEFRQQKKSVAVFAIDPSSTISEGAILGDRIRMYEHYRDSQVYIRSMGARGALGGVAKATRSAIRLASLLNFDYILVETVGIGQSESEIINIADTTLLVLMPNSGDEIQLMKAGVIQLADIYVINKCDLADPARMVQELSENTARLNPDDWQPPVLKTAAVNQEGVKEVVEKIFLHADYENKDGKGKSLRKMRLKKEILQNVLSMAEAEFQKEIEKIPDSQIEEFFYGKITAMYLADLIYRKSK